MIGHGPYMMSNYVPSQSFNYKRNEAYFDKDFTQRRDQMPSSRSTRRSLAVQGRQHPLLHGAARGRRDGEERGQSASRSTARTNPGTNVVTFGKLPDGKSPFDERVRQAFSMSWDRDLFIDVFYNVSKFERRLPVDCAGTRTCRRSGATGSTPRARTSGPTPSTQARRREAEADGRGGFRQRLPGDLALHPGQPAGRAAEDG